MLFESPLRIRSSVCASWNGNISVEISLGFPKNWENHLERPTLVTAESRTPWLANSWIWSSFTQKLLSPKFARITLCTNIPYIKAIKQTNKDNHPTIQYPKKQKTVTSKGSKLVCNQVFSFSKELRGIW